jgi:hypothetical protein
MMEAVRLAPRNKQLREELNALTQEIKIKRQVQNEICHLNHITHVANLQKADKLAYGSFFDKAQGSIYEAQRPRVFFEVAQGKTLFGRVEIELHSHKVPKTARNFYELCVGHTTAAGKKLHYQGTLFHRVVEGFIAQGGDTSGTTGKVSVFLLSSVCSRNWWCAWTCRCFAEQVSS